MPKIPGLHLNKSTIFKIIAIFLIAYFISLFIWIQVKDRYCYTTAFITSKIVAGLKDAKLEDISVQEGVVQVTFSPLDEKVFMMVTIPIKTNYTFNAPLTIGIMAALYLFIKNRKRAYTEVALILLTVHILYVFSFEMKELTEFFMNRGVEKVNQPKAYLYQFLWVFTRSMIIRFEPFLIGFYMYMRFAQQSSEKPSSS
jgi:hypothetical protein